MKSFKTFSPIFLLLTIFLFNACGNDDDISCVESDFIGDWSGDVVCDSSNISTSQFDVVDSDGTFILLFIGTELETTIEGCNISAAGVFGTANIEIEGIYNGTNMEVNIEYKNDSFVDDNCKGTFLKN